MPTRGTGTLWPPRHRRPRLDEEDGPLLIEHILHRKGSDVVTVAPDASVADAVGLLREHNIGALVVVGGAAVDQGADDTAGERAAGAPAGVAGVAGILSERDIVRSLGVAATASAAPTDEPGAGGGDPLSVPVAALMSTDVTTCVPSATVDDLIRVMTERRIRHIPVVEGGTLVGIVSIGDVVKSRVDELETETETLHDYLASGR